MKSPRPQLMKEEKSILEKIFLSRIFSTFVFWLIFISFCGYLLRGDIPEDLHGIAFVYVPITTAAFIALWLTEER